MSETSNVSDVPSPADMLAIHRQVWDMPTLAAEHPTVLKHLASRYEVHFGMLRTGSDVVVVHVASGVAEDMHTCDVRVAVETLLAREAENASR